MALRFAGIRLACSRAIIRDRNDVISPSKQNAGFFRRMCTKPEAELIKTAEQSKIPAQSSESATAAQTMGKGLTGHKPDKLDRIWLVWGGKYKKLSDVPTHVGQDTMEMYRNKARIKINIMMGIATLLGCLMMIWSGKLAAQRGDSVTKMNEDFHRAYKLQKQKEMEVAAAKG